MSLDPTTLVTILFIFVFPYHPVCCFVHVGHYPRSHRTLYLRLFCLSNKEFKGDSWNYKIGKAFWLQKQMYTRKGSSSSLKHLTLVAPRVPGSGYDLDPELAQAGSTLRQTLGHLQSRHLRPRRASLRTFPCRGSLHFSRDRARKGRESFSPPPPSPP